MVTLLVKSASVSLPGEYRGDAGHDLAETPLEIEVGETAAVDFLIDFPSPADSLYAAEFRWVVTSVDGGRIWLIDADPDTPTVQVELIGPLADLEQLIVPVIGFPAEPGYVRDCTFDANPPAGSDSIYNFVKGATGDDISVPLMPLDQHNRQEWGDSWCGPTAAGTSLAWFAEMNPGGYGSLVPDSNDNQTLDDADKYDAINRIGMAMGTSSADGTTDGDLVDGIATYITDAGLSSDFSIKVFNIPRYFHYANELMTGDEDVLVGISSGDWGHWLVGRSLSTERHDAETPGDPQDDYYPVSFVDPGTGSVYHSRIHWNERMIWYNGEWVNFDIMVSVSPADTSPNDPTAQLFVAQNHVTVETVEWVHNFTFTLIGDPNDQNPRTPELSGDPLWLARAHIIGRALGRVDLNFHNTLGSGPTVKLASIDGNSVPGLIPDVEHGDPAAVINVIPVGGNPLEVAAKLQGPSRLDPEGYEIPLDVSLYSPGADILNDSPVGTYGCDRMERGIGDNGPVGICQLAVEESGVFDVVVKSARTLRHVKRGVAIPGGANFFGPAHDPVDERGLHEGDNNEDDTINVLDFSLFLDTWNDTCANFPPGGIGDFSHGDYDKNCSVNVLDFSIFLANWREKSPQED